MRITAGDGRRAMVYLNGDPVRLCLMADEEFGVIEVCVTDDYGRVMRNGLEVRKKLLYGSVKIRVLPSVHKQG